MRILLAEEQPKYKEVPTPFWAFVPDDEFGRQQAELGIVFCKACRAIQSHKNKACQHCCKHEVLRLSFERLECRPLNISMAILSVECEKCGKKYGQDEWEELFGRRLVNLVAEEKQ